MIILIDYWVVIVMGQLERAGWRVSDVTRHVISLMTHGHPANEKEIQLPSPQPHCTQYQSLALWLTLDGSHISS